MVAHAHPQTVTSPEGTRPPNQTRWGPCEEKAPSPRSAPAGCFHWLSHPAAPPASHRPWTHRRPCSFSVLTQDSAFHRLSSLVPLNVPDNMRGLMVAHGASRRSVSELLTVRCEKKTVCLIHTPPGYTEFKNTSEEWRDRNVKHQAQTFQRDIHVLPDLGGKHHQKSFQSFLLLSPWSSSCSSPGPHVHLASGFFKADSSSHSHPTPATPLLIPHFSGHPCSSGAGSKPVSRKKPIPVEGIYSSATELPNEHVYV